MSHIGDHRASNEDLEPRIRDLLAAKLIRRTTGPYRTLTTAEATVKLERLLRAEGVTEFSLEAVARMPGGASKEQFWFDLVTAAGRERLVLRMDPLEGIVETCRFREAELVHALRDHVPVARIRFADPEGQHLGQPGIVTSFVRGLSKPPADQDAVVSGIGTSFSPAWRERLTPHFIDTLAAIHAFDWRHAGLQHFEAPVEHATQAALWQVNWWAKVWREDLIHAYPLLTLAERWMRERLPPCEDPVLLHGDYRTSNFMFDAETGAFTAVLDWELAHIGDFHEDLGWIVQKLFAGAAEGGESYVCGLVPREAFLRRYEAATGRHVDRKTLAFYEAFAAYKLAAMSLGTSVGLTNRSNNHQDVVLTFLSPAGHTFLHQLVDAIREEAAA